MEDKKDDNNCSDPKTPGIPPNYVSLLQLQQRWLKEKERKEKEKQEEEKAVGAVTSAPQKPRDGATRGGIRSNPNRNNRDSTVTALLTVEANAVEVTVDDEGSKNVDGSCEGERETGKQIRKKWRKNKKKVEKEVVQKGVESEATSPVAKGEKAQEKRVKCQIQWRAVKSEKENVGPRMSNGRRKGKKAEESDGTVEVEPKIGDISIGKKDEKVEKQNKVAGRHRRENRDHNRDGDNLVGQKMVEIKQKNDDVSIEEKDEKVEKPNKVVGRRSRENRNHNRNVDYGVGQKMVEIKPESEDVSTEEKNGKVEEEDKVVGHSGRDADSENVKNGSGGYRGSNGGNRWWKGYGIANRENGWNRAGYGNANRGGNRAGYGNANRGGNRLRTENGMVWVKKGEIGYGGQVTNCGSSLTEGLD